MFRLFTDEDFQIAITLGLRRRLSNLDIETIQEAGLLGSPDSELLDYAATCGRILVSHDFTTMPAAIEARIESGLPMAGVFLLPQLMPTGAAISELEMLIECSTQSEWTGLTTYLPF